MKTNLFELCKKTVTSLSLLLVLAACGKTDDKSVEPPPPPPAKETGSAKNEVEQAKPDNTSSKPTMKIKKISEVTPEEWNEIITAIINTNTQLLLNNEVYVIINENGVFPFWRNKKNLISMGFPLGEILEKNPYLLKQLNESPSDFKKNDFSLLDSAPLTEEEKAVFREQRAKIEAILPFVISESQEGFTFNTVQADAEPGKYVVTYKKEMIPFTVNIYDIVTYKDGSYQDINPEDNFGTEKIQVAGQDVYQDEFSTYWRNTDHVFDIKNTKIKDEILPLVTAYLKKFPSEKF